MSRPVVVVLMGPWSAQRPTGDGRKISWELESLSANVERTGVAAALFDPKHLTDVVPLEKSWINVPGTQVLLYNCTPSAARVAC